MIYNKCCCVSESVIFEISGLIFCIFTFKIKSNQNLQHGHLVVAGYKEKNLMFFAKSTKGFFVKKMKKKVKERTLNSYSVFVL